MLCMRNFRRTFSNALDSSKPLVTALYDFHVENGGKLVNFGGYLLPVQYNDQSISNSHLHTRKSASLFDVSHMLQTEITGSNCINYFEKLCTADLRGLTQNSSALTVFTNERGGILDDLIVTKLADNHLYIVSNAARKDHDLNLMQSALANYNKTQSSDNPVKLRFFSSNERSLLALQGPKSAEILQKLTDTDLTKLYFMTTTVANVSGVTCRITRCGYTGEDGFEISIPSNKAVFLAKEIIKNGEAKLAGLGARDSLRLEAGLCLYGSDLTEETTPVEGGLTWLVSKKRRENLNFPGAEIIVKQIKDGVSKKRVGLISSTGPPGRHGAAIFNESGSEQIGEITSGCPGPSLGKNVAMGYVKAKYFKVGTKLNLKIREKLYETVVTKMPFVKANYYTKPN